jgi:outer membrane lipoprotein-sorting protein
MSSSTPSISGLGASVLSLALVTLGLPGCAARQGPETVAPVPPPVTMSLAERNRELTSLQTRAIMEYSGPAGHIKVREQVTARRPAGLRIEAMSPLGVAMIVAADHEQIAVYNPSNNTLMRGVASAATLARFIQIQMPPEHAVQLLLGLAPDDSILANAPAAEWSEGELRVLSYAGQRDIQYELGFDGDQLALVRARDSSKHALYEIHYHDYRDIGAIKFPFQIEAQFFTNATTVKLHYLDPAIDRPIADSTFELSPSPGTKLIEIGLAAPALPKKPG